MSTTTPARRERPMGRAELMSEVEWLLDGHVHPLAIAEQLGRKPASITKAAHQQNNRRVVEAFSSPAKAAA